MYERLILHSYPSTVNSLLMYCMIYYWSGKIMSVPQIECINLQVFSKISRFSVINYISANIQSNPNTAPLAYHNLWWYIKDSSKSKYCVTWNFCSQTFIDAK